MQHREEVDARVDVRRGRRRRDIAGTESRARSRAQGRSSSCVCSSTTTTADVRRRMSSRGEPRSPHAKYPGVDDRNTVVIQQVSRRRSGHATPAERPLELGLRHLRAAADVAAPWPPRRAGRACGRAGPCDGCADRPGDPTRCPRARASTTLSPRRSAPAPCSRCAPRSPRPCPRTLRARAAESLMCSY